MHLGSLFRISGFSIPPPSLPAVPATLAIRKSCHHSGERNIQPPEKWNVPAILLTVKQLRHCPDTQLQEALDLSSLQPQPWSSDHVAVVQASPTWVCSCQACERQIAVFLIQTLGLSMHLPVRLFWKPCRSFDNIAAWVGTADHCPLRNRESGVDRRCCRTLYRNIDYTLVMRC